MPETLADNTCVYTLACKGRGLDLIVSVPHSSFLIPHSSFLIPHSSFLIPHSSFLIPHSLFPVPCSLFPKIKITCLILSKHPLRVVLTMPPC